VAGEKHIDLRARRSDAMEIREANQDFISKAMPDTFTL
jgi:hypothetical protein